MFKKYAQQHIFTIYFKYHISFLRTFANGMITSI